MNMDEDELKQLAAQLRQPTGDMGIEVGIRMNHGNLHMNTNTLQAIQLKPGNHVVEIGMGNGHFVQNIFKMYGDVQYSGCDFSELMVKESIKNNELWVAENKAHFYHTTAHKLPLDTNSVDVIFTINTLYFWENPVLILAEFKRVLKNTGQLFITIRPKWYMEKMAFTKYGFTMYNETEVKELLVTNGFKVKNIQEYLDPPIVVEGEEVSPLSIIVEGVVK